MTFKRLILILLLLFPLHTFNSYSIDLKLLGSYGGAFYDVKVQGNYAYVATANGLKIFDVSNPSSPELIGFYNMKKAAMSVYVSGKIAYVADETGGLAAINVRNSSSPKLLATYDTDSYAHGVYFSDNKAYIADGPGGLKIIEISK